MIAAREEVRVRDWVQRKRGRAADFYDRIEAPTWLLLCAIYGAWLALTFFWNSLPFWIAVPAGAWLCAWHVSLQHELMHGHPTRSERVNAALAWPPINLWLPYVIYREQHIRHHRDAHLTDPLEDPESTYLSPEAWKAAGPAGRFLHSACNTLAGRLLLGPARAVARFWLDQAGQWRDAASRKIWLRHLAGVALVLLWLSGVCHISPLSYVAFCVYPGTALNMVRSLAEHRAADRPEDRTAVVEKAGLLGLLFLNNNLHVLHHASPSIPWYKLPAQWRTQRDSLLRAHHGPVYSGYLQIAARTAWRPLHPGPHPASEVVAE